MEKVVCDKHETICLLKTGVRDGPNKGKSFYLCGAQRGDPCDFTRRTDIPPSHCLLHEDSLVELQALVKQDDRQHYRLFFRCVEGKTERRKWCGNIPWQHPEPKKNIPTSDRESEFLKPRKERNPFKAQNGNGEPSDWKVLHENGGGKDEERKGGVESGSETSSKGPTPSTDWRNRQLPAGVKIKTRSPAEAENSGKLPKEVIDKSKTGEDNSPADTSEDKSGTDHLEIEKASHLDNGQLKGIPVEGEKPVRISKHSDLKKHEKPNKGEKSKYSTDTKERGSIGEMHLKDSSTKERQSDQKKDHVSETHKKEQKSKQEEASRENSSDAPEGSGVTKKESPKTKETGVHLERKKEASNGEPSKGQPSADAGGTYKSFGEHVVEKEKRVEQKHGDVIVIDDEEDVVGSAPASQKQPVAVAPVKPALSMVQKTITSFPGFNPASQLQHNSMALHNQLATQLKQKKVKPSHPATMTTVNLSALPDKGQRLLNQVKELEDALGSLSLTPVSDCDGNQVALPDKGQRLLNQVKELEDALGSLSLTPVSDCDGNQVGTGNSLAMHQVSVPSQFNPFCRTSSDQKGTILLDKPLPYQDARSGTLGLQFHGGPSFSQGYGQAYGVNSQYSALYGGRMTDDRLLAVRNATADAIDHLHKSLESCPTAETEAEDPKGLKVTLLPHQKQALAWLLWRETQKPCGGILGNIDFKSLLFTVIELVNEIHSIQLQHVSEGESLCENVNFLRSCVLNLIDTADDMGLGKTLTMIALILSQKAKEKKKEKEDKKQEGWISKSDSSCVNSQGTLIICPASLIHHWKKEIERHVKGSKLSVYVYHGANRERNAKVLAEYDVVITTYSLVSKEIPVKKEDGDKPAKDDDDQDISLPRQPLVQVTWCRIILDEGHNIKNPRVQTSMAVCKLRAGKRWVVTGTPIQNNLLDMYSLLKFLRCSPFDEYKLWKNQVDNGSKRGGERLNILTKTLLLRRTKDQLDSSGKPLVSLPERCCQTHRLKLSEDEQSVYDVVFAQSRSTLQSYLKRHEGGDSKHSGQADNPFDKVAREFGASQSGSQPQSQASSTVHILSLLLRLRQCCGHLSLLKKTLDHTELQNEGITLSLDEQLNALSLSELSSPDLKSTVSLNGTKFKSDLFDDTRESTKISAILAELKEIKSGPIIQKSVIVSQWTSMLRVVAVHLDRIGLRCATIDGSVNPKKRMDLVEEFNTNPKGPEVMLVSLCAGGVGINLIGGNHLFLLDMHWNPALEDQACDRIYRVGQIRSVTIHRFVCEGTVEDKITELQDKKKELAKKVLSGTGDSFTKLTLADLKILFGV
ncbi:Transcription termination factor 2 [Acipenser ruthenus]|uniref:Transcription termination factor 2 n=1 Tax=Acipenser ruthenus TaxID=7906 RepID=A0A444UFI1_ACIRT|nr:Transcription termination factor 2 [Acipenser ruthenus]